ncbi:alkaline shock response membrane anchor protein AmaP [Streptomyces sp. NPDC006658]|uniref:alkaline shock response membrane anchor protein AmaP n=1 Tax=Streptomyces sp. NPDC006658 TaxID=3156900 RepID=UPI0033C7BAC8
MVRTVNRVLLGLLGLGLFALGGGVLLGGLDLPRRWDFGMPGWWPFRGPGDVVLGTGVRTRWREEGWWWPAVIAVLVVLLALWLWWLVAQRRHRLGDVLVDSGDGAAVRLDGGTLEDAIEAEARDLDGVARAHVRLTGRSTAPAVRVRLVLEPHADPAWVLGQLSRETIAHARDSAGLDRLPSKVRLKEVRHHARRVG